MTQHSTTTLTMYPPSSLGYPQFIAPFGDDNGRRAAVRVFFGDREGRHMSSEQLDVELLVARWGGLQSYAKPAALSRAVFRPSVVDLDPQVDELTRAGSSLDLPCYFLLTALSAAEFVSASLEQDAPTPRFRAQIGSIWSSALPNEGLSEAVLGAQFERFIDHCTIDVSGRRNLFFMPEQYRALCESRVIEIQDELDIVMHSFDETLARMRPIFFHAEGQSTHNVCFFDPHSTSLNVLLEVFSSCWIEATERVESGASPRSGRLERELVPGMMLGERYEINSRIGSGGFAIVYEARDIKVSRQVAIKVIDLERNIEERSRQSYIKRFEREARLAVSVRHPCVVEVLDVGVTQDDVPYIVMERLEGWDLDSQSRRHGPMRPSRLIPLFIQALEGLGCAHEKDIVHKDLKPSNIYLKNPGKRHEQLCILDFGVARRINTATARLTHTDSAFGTPHYMAPEYSTSQIATPALDVYQMGLILVEMLMGEPVVSHPEPVAAMFQHVRGDLSVPEELLDSELGEILRCALATNHLHRYQDGFEFADALRQLQNLDRLPMLERGAHRISLHQGDGLGDPESEARETPVMGANLLNTTDRFRSSKNMGLVRAEQARPIAELAREPALVPEISPFASTLPFDDLPEQLAGLHASSEPIQADSAPSAPTRQSIEPPYSPPPFARPAEPSSEEKLPEPLDPEQDAAEIVDYSSKKPYIFLISFLCIALLVTTIALLRNKRQLQDITSEPTKPPVVTEHDRKLADLRERAARLEPMLQSGKIEEVIAEVKAMDELDVRLKPDEVEVVRAIVEQARQERVNRKILDRAVELMNKREHERALMTLDTISSGSVFWSHPDTQSVLDRAKVALLPQVQRLRDQGYPERSQKILELLMTHDPHNVELIYLSMEIRNDLTAQPPALLPIKEDDMGVIRRPDMGEPVEEESDAAADLSPSQEMR